MKPVVLALAVAAYTLLGCDRGAAPDGDKASKQASVGGTTIKLLQPGNGPRKALRLTPTKGMKMAVTFVMDTVMTMDLGGSPTTQRIPTIKAPMDLVVTDVTADRDIRYEFTMRDLEISADESAAAMVEQVKSLYAGMRLSGYAVTTNRGFTKAAEIKVASDANPQIKQLADSFKQSIAQMSAPLPEEEVGVGATWETTMTMVQNGMTLKQVATTELVSLEGNVVTAKVSMMQSAEPQKITANGMTVDLKSLKGSGTGETVVDLTKVMPTRAKAAMKSDIQMQTGDQKVGMSFELVMTMTSE